MTISPLGNLSFELGIFPPTSPILECRPFSWRKSVNSLSNGAWYQPRRRDRQTSPTKGCRCGQQQLCLPHYCIEVLLRGACCGWGGEWLGPRQRLEPVALPAHGDVFKISPSKVEDLRWSQTPSPICLSWNYREMKQCPLRLDAYLTAHFVAVSGQIHLHGLYFIFYFAIIYFNILSRVSHKRTRARMFGKLTDDI